MMTRIQALKTLMEADGGRRITMGELKELSKDERTELIDLAIVELGLVPGVTVTAAE